MHCWPTPNLQRWKQTHTYVHRLLVPRPPPLTKEPSEWRLYCDDFHGSVGHGGRSPFSDSKHPLIPLADKVEEELFPDYRASRYYPVTIGQILRERYQIVGKLGFGASSTVWLARDLE